ncbi:MAG: response regulator [Sinobacteraceae bacterium]|nr:response regulator [Nevskiaceae bacterium]
MDDEPDSLDILARMLRNAGARVITASDATDGLDKLQREQPGILISDIGLPAMDGYEFIRRARAVSSVPAIALTAFARPEDRRRALLAGFQLHVSKPVDPEELVIIVASLAGRIPAVSA